MIPKHSNRRGVRSWPFAVPGHEHGHNSPDRKALFINMVSEVGDGVWLPRVELIQKMHVSQVVIDASKAIARNLSDRRNPV